MSCFAPEHRDAPPVNSSHWRMRPHESQKPRISSSGLSLHYELLLSNASVYEAICVRVLLSILSKAEVFQV